MGGADHGPRHPPLSEDSPEAADRPPQSPIPKRGRLIGVDYGAVRVGLAVCDPDQQIASAMNTYSRQNDIRDAEFFRTLACTEAAAGWVVGLAINLNDTEGPKAKECRAFGTWLQHISGLPVVYQDERFTTAAAEDTLREAKLPPSKRKALRDRIAAQLILQAYLDTPRDCQQ